MKIITGFILACVIMFSCNPTNKQVVLAETPLPLVGTWQLISGTTIQKTDTAITYYNKELSFIKIINNTHFAFLKHDLTKGKGPDAAFGSGGGSYSLKDSMYTEHLEYCSDREWEGNDFSFAITIQQDTLIQKGIEKVAAAGVDRLNIEKYVRLKN